MLTYFHNASYYNKLTTLYNLYIIDIVIRKIREGCSEKFLGYQYILFFFQIFTQNHIKQRTRKYKRYIPPSKACKKSSSIKTKRVLFPEREIRKKYERMRRFRVIGEEGRGKMQAFSKQGGQGGRKE